MCSSFNPAFPPLAHPGPAKGLPPLHQPRKASFLKVAAVTKVWALPSTHRMTADGFLQSAGRLGAVTGPLIRMTRQAVPLLAPVSYGVIPIASSLILLFLPETRGLPLPDTVQDLESQ